MTALHSVQTVEAFPLGKPYDGRDRYSMTPEQAMFYRLLVNDNGATTEPFQINSRNYAMRMMYRGHSRIHNLIDKLVERGWLTQKKIGVYEFVHPVMKFKERRSV